MYKKLLKLNNKKANYPIKKWVKNLNRHLTEEDIQMADKILKDAPHHMSSGKHKLKWQ